MVVWISLLGNEVNSISPLTTFNSNQNQKDLTEVKVLKPNVKFLKRHEGLDGNSQKATV